MAIIPQNPKAFQFVNCFLINKLSVKIKGLNILLLKKSSVKTFEMKFRVFFLFLENSTYDCIVLESFEYFKPFVKSAQSYNNKKSIYTIIKLRIQWFDKKYYKINLVLFQVIVIENQQLFSAFCLKCKSFRLCLIITVFKKLNPHCLNYLLIVDLGHKFGKEK